MGLAASSSHWAIKEALAGVPALRARLVRAALASLTTGLFLTRSA